MANVDITPDPYVQQEPSVAVNWLNPSVMVATATDFRSGPPLIGVYQSIDAGATWNNALLPLPDGFAGAESAHIDYMYPYTFIVVAHVFDSAGLSGSVAVYRSTNNGSSFFPPVIVNQGFGQFVNDDETTLVIDKSGASPYTGNVYLIYTHQYNVNFIGGIVVMFCRSTDGGITFDTPIRISDVSQTEQQPGITVGLVGNVLVGWIPDDITFTDFFVTASTDGGTTFGASVRVSNVSLVPSPLPVPGYEFRVLTYANLAADISATPGAQERIYAVWQDYRLGYAAIFLSSSNDNGKSWSPAIQVSDSPAGAQNFFPYISVNPVDGSVNIIYYTNRLNGYDLDVFVAISDDNGSTWQPNQRITDTSFDPNAGSPTPTPLIGDFIGSAFVPQIGRLVAVWTDTRTGSQNIWTG